MTWRPEWWLVLPVTTVLVVLLVLTLRQWGRATTGQRSAALSRVVVAAGLVLVVLRPSGQHEVETPVASRVDLLVMLDRTGSMGALDHAGGSRMDAAGEDLAEVVATSGGARVTVIAFDDTARVVVPGTTDARGVVTTLRTIGWRPSAKATGSDISVGLELARETLAQAATERPDSRRVLVYAGDGEQTLSSEPASFSELATLVDEAWVLGYGTAGGGRMPVAPGDEQLVTRGGVDQLSRMDEQALHTIADDLGGTYLHRGGGADLPDVAVSTAREREVVPGAEYYWIAALVVAPAALLQVFLAVRRWRAVKEEM